MFKKLLGNKILIAREEENKEAYEKRDSGLFVPSQQQQQAMEDIGTVAQVGQECKDVAKGDTIMFDKMAVRDIEVNGQRYFLLNEESVVGVV